MPRIFTEIHETTSPYNTYVLLHSKQPKHYKAEKTKSLIKLNQLNNLICFGIHKLFLQP